MRAIVHYVRHANCNVVIYTYNRTRRLYNPYTICCKCTTAEKKNKLVYACNQFRSGATEMMNLSGWVLIPEFDLSENRLEQFQLCKKKNFFFITNFWEKFAQLNFSPNFKRKKIDDCYIYEKIKIKMCKVHKTSKQRIYANLIVLILSLKYQQRFETVRLGNLSRHMFITNFLRWWQSTVWAQFDTTQKLTIRNLKKKMTERKI